MGKDSLSRTLSSCRSCRRQQRVSATLRQSIQHSSVLGSPIKSQFGSSEGCRPVGGLFVRRASDRPESFCSLACQTGATSSINFECEIILDCLREIRHLHEVESSSVLEVESVQFSKFRCIRGYARHQVVSIETKLNFSLICNIYKRWWQGSSVDSSASPPWVCSDGKAWELKGHSSQAALTQFLRELERSWGA